MDVLLLSRIQFALTVGFHYIYPPISIGLGLILVIMEGLYLKTGKPLYHQMTKFWVKIFALIFSIGVATGIVMEFEFGTNWAAYSRYVGDIFGSPLAAEGLLAFFLESGFLGVLVFGWDKVKPKMHFFSTIMVCLGAHLSAFWIIVANSWQQTPTGYKIVTNGVFTRAEITDFWAMVFNPSTIDRFTHTLVGAWLTGAFMVISIAAYYLLKKQHLEFAKSSMKIGLVVAAVASILQLGTGHLSSIGVSRNQPIKLAAFEGHFAASAPADLSLLGWVNEKEGKMDFKISLPGFLSLLVSGRTDTPVTGLNSVSRDLWPPLNIVFQTYHIMVGIGMALIGLSFLCLFLWWRNLLFENTLILKLLTLSFILPQVANQTGWMTAEIGRQPWIVYGLLKTKDALSKVVSAEQVLTSLVFFTLIYILLFCLFVFLMWQKIQKGPEINERTV